MVLVDDIEFSEEGYFKSIIDKILKQKKEKK